MLNSNVIKQIINLEKSNSINVCPDKCLTKVQFYFYLLQHCQEVYSEPYQTSTIECLGKKFNSFETPKDTILNV